MQIIIRWRTTTPTRTEGRLAPRGFGEAKFGLLKLEFYRHTRKQLRKQKLDVLALPQLTYTVTIRLSVPYFEPVSMVPVEAPVRTVKIMWACECLGSLAIGQVRFRFKASPCQFLLGLEYSLPHHASYS